MKEITITVNTSDPDTIGEWLRGIFFDQSKGARGGYSTFELNENVQELERELVNLYWLDDSPNTTEFWTCAETWIVGLGCVKMRYWWDGDLEMQFIFDDGYVVVNTDGKHDYGWEWRKVEDDDAYYHI